MKPVPALLLLLALSVTCSALAADYHFSVSGDDHAGDGSRTTPWASISKANTLDLEPGDRLLFKGGETFSTALNGLTHLLEDPGFESGTLDAWEFTFDRDGGSTSVVLDKRDVYAATLSGKGIAGRGRSATELFVPGRTYTLCFLASRTGQGGAWAAAGVTFGAKGEEISAGTAEIASAPFARASWTTYGVTFTAPEGFDHALIWMYKGTGESSVHFADFEIRESIPLTMTAEDSGTPTTPVIIGTYGPGRAIISSPFSTAYSATNVGGIEIRGVDFRGDGRRISGQHGLHFLADGEAGEKFEHIVLDRIVVGGFGDRGILLQGNAALSGFRGVSLTNAEVYGNGFAHPTQGTSGGFEMRGHAEPLEKSISHENVYLGHSAFHGNASSGAVLASLRNGTIEHCRAYGNSGGNAGLGLWVWEVDNVLVQHNVSHDNWAPDKDGGGIDLDGGTTNSTVQYNYTFDNGGAGYLLAQYAGASRMGGNVFRYNISQDDGWAVGFGGITVFSGQGNLPADETVFHNNVVYASKGASSAVRFLSGGERVKNVRFYNNVFMTCGGRPLLRTRATLHRSNRFAGNSYHAAGGGFLVDWLGTRHSSLASWLAASDQERLDGTLMAVSEDPMLTAPGLGDTDAGSTVLEAFRAYAPKPGSPLIDAGIDLWDWFGRSPGLSDIRGAAIPFGNGYDIGAVEASNRIANGGFEEGMTGWGWWGEAAPSDAAPHLGASALRIGNGAGGAVALVTGSISTGAAYRLQAWGKVGSVGDAGTVGFTFKKEGLTIAEHSREITATSYEPTLIEFAAPEDFDSAHAWVLKPLGSGVLWVDEFELVELRPAGMPN
jgi:hypothetical protein